MDDIFFPVIPEHCHGRIIAVDKFVTLNNKHRIDRVLKKGSIFHLILANLYAGLTKSLHLLSVLFCIHIKKTPQREPYDDWNRQRVRPCQIQCVMNSCRQQTNSNHPSPRMKLP